MFFGGTAVARVEPTVLSASIAERAWALSRGLLTLRYTRLSVLVTEAESPAKLPPTCRLSDERLAALGAKDPASESGTTAPAPNARNEDSALPAVALRYLASQPEENVVVEPVAISVSAWALKWDRSTKDAPTAGTNAAFPAVCMALIWVKAGCRPQPLETGRALAAGTATVGRWA